MVERLAIYRRLIGAQVRGQASYRASFLLDLGGQLVAPVIDVLAILAVFRVARTLGGFTALALALAIGIIAIIGSTITVRAVDRRRTRAGRGERLGQG